MQYQAQQKPNLAATCAGFCLFLGIMGIEIWYFVMNLTLWNTLNCPGSLPIQLFIHTSISIVLFVSMISFVCVVLCKSRSYAGSANKETPSMWKLKCMFYLPFLIMLTWVVTGIWAVVLAFTMDTCTDDEGKIVDVKSDGLALGIPLAIIVALILCINLRQMYKSRAKIREFRAMFALAGQLNMK